jgi:glycosyltransferase involved in cell wall biosynthesis
MKFIPAFEISFFTITFCLLAFVVIVQIMYVLFIYSKLAFHKTKPIDDHQNWMPISVIITARNESDNLYENLPAILSQDYPAYEVIVVNNQSIDDSGWILTAYAQQFPNLRIVELSKNRHLRPGKKLPITLAIKAAKYEHFVLTDADCKPVNDQWIKQMASQYSSSKQIVIGYAPFLKNKGFLNRLIRFDTAWIGVNYFSMALAKLPYMGVGRNLAYTKSVFHSVNGFKSHYSVTTGDDVLFIQEAAKKSNYSIQLNPDSFCYSQAPTTWTRWMTQKTRHYAASGKYRFIKKLLLGIYPVSLILMWVSFITLLFSKDFILLSSSIFGFTLLLKWWLQGRCLSLLKEKSFIRFLPFWDLLYALLMPILFYISERQKYYRW